MTTLPKDRSGSLILCGYCSTSVLAEDPGASHLKCPGHCACGELNHKVTGEIAKRISASHPMLPSMTPERVMELHGRKKRVLTPEQREAATERLRAAREAKSKKAP